MKTSVKRYFRTLKELFDKVVITNANGKNCKINEAIDITMRLIINQTASGGKLIFIGNGASAAISSHMATDFWKNANIKAIAFNDSSLLTCVSNDCGFKYVFEKPIAMFANMGDVLIAVSSSGKSENILQGVKTAKKRNVKVITLSGFKKDNPLRKMGDINFYVPRLHYGFVEITHLALCHCLVDMIIKRKNG